MAKADAHAAHDREIDLADGRRLAYLDIGRADGEVVISNHGGLSSRLDVLPAAESAGAHGLRIISPDRPGIGRSAPAPHRTLRTWADDVGVLADRLELEQFAVMGWSFGGCFAQSVARYLGDRAVQLVLVASAIPRAWAGMRADIDRMDRVLMRLSEHAAGRAVDRTIFHLMGATARLAPERFARSSGFTSGTTTDLVDLAAAIAEGLSDTEGVVRDYEILDGPWEFDPSEIEVPTRIWQGDADELVPAAWAERLRDAIQGSTLTVVPGATHFLWYDHWDDIFDGIAEGFARR
jgi:pimeloyl-ACP methyl ester carboxylesterase